MTSTVIVAGARTPIGRINGGLSSIKATDLGGIAIKGALERARVAGEDVEYVIMGQVLQAGVGQMPARQAAVAGGIPMSVQAVTVNKVCLSGMNAIIMADQMIRAGDYKVIVAGGMESMTRAPHLLPGSRAGYKYGDVTILDHLEYDALHDAFTDEPMGIFTEGVNDRDPISRVDQDAYSARSHRLAAAAAGRGTFKAEIEPVTIKSRRGDVVIEIDEGVRADTTAESLAKLRPAFRKDGTITAGNASQISDGAAAVVLMSRDEAERRGLDWIAEITTFGAIAGPDSSLQDKPARAIVHACEKIGITPQELDLFEINEAFAAIGLASERELGVDGDKVNVNGGAISMGHPVGMTGTRITLHLALELQRRGGGLGAAAMCGGSGQGDAILITVPKG